jgi:hypothetical protein
MRIIRYSVDGFKPQKRTHHLAHYDYMKNKMNINDFPEHLRWQIEKNTKQHIAFYEEHMEDLKEGVWFFIAGHKNNQSLNHLDHKVPCWEAEIDDDVLVYDCNWEKVIPLTDPLVTLAGCYIPKRCLTKIHNIKKVQKHSK